MNKRKIFLTLGAFALAIGGAYASYFTLPAGQGYIQVVKPPTGIADCQIDRVCLGGEDPCKSLVFPAETLYDLFENNCIIELGQP
ncbi:hypothetical protein AAHN97_16090 [Chitinophaga niabensis]|uniref:hypothetical protein n=1 Tax=Chitinophaga niabensis TaxID=536979 RepID=UPI0031BA2D11